MSLTATTPRVTREKNATADEAAVYRLAQPPDGGRLTPRISSSSRALVQMPHLDPVKEIEKRAGRPLTEIEQRHLADRRARGASLGGAIRGRGGKDAPAGDAARAGAGALRRRSARFCKAWPRRCRARLWKDDALQAKIFEVARLTPIEQALAFKAIYRVLLDREAGPKAGNLLAFLNPAFVIPRFQELPVTREEFWRDTAISMRGGGALVCRESRKDREHQLRDGDRRRARGAGDHGQDADGKKQLKRVRLESDSRPPDFLGSTSGGLLA